MSVATRPLKCSRCGHQWSDLVDDHGEGRCPTPHCPKCSSQDFRIVQTQNLYRQSGMEQEAKAAWDKADSANHFIVCVKGEFVCILNPPTMMPMCKAEALNLAAWLVALADPDGTKFKQMLEQVTNS